MIWLNCDIKNIYSSIKNKIYMAWMWQDFGRERKSQVIAKLFQCKLPISPMFQREKERKRNSSKKQSLMQECSVNCLTVLFLSHKACVSTHRSDWLSQCECMSQCEGVRKQNKGRDNEGVSMRNNELNGKWNKKKQRNGAQPQCPHESQNPAGRLIKDLNYGNEEQNGALAVFWPK